jgi:hypothetical protein
LLLGLAVLLLVMFFTLRRGPVSQLEALRSQGYPVSLVFSPTFCCGSLQARLAALASRSSPDSMFSYSPAPNRFICSAATLCLSFMRSTWPSVMT